jgi:hypothetical protein
MILLETILDNLAKYSSLFFMIAALYGAHEWKRQIKWKIKYEVAQKYLKTSLQLRDAIKRFRNPWISVGEQVEVLKKNGYDFENEEHKKYIDISVYSERWKLVFQNLREIEATLLEAESLELKGIHNQHENLMALVRELRVIMWNISSNRDSSWKIDQELIYDKGEDDDYTRKIESSVEGIKKILKPYLR